MRDLCSTREISGGAELVNYCEGEGEAAERHKGTTGGGCGRGNEVELCKEVGKFLRM
jgi:hypothetical protein